MIISRLLRLGILCVPTMDDESITTLLRAIQESHKPTVLAMTTSALSQRNWIEELLQHWCDVEELDLVLTVGGTLPAPGPSAAEIVPEATQAVCERLIPGLAEAMRYHAQQESSLAWLERGVAGIRGRSLIVNLPAGAAPALLFLEAILDLLPVVVGHLHEEPTTPRLLDEVGIEEEAAEEENTPVPPTATPQKGLRADDCAAFLARNKSTADEGGNE
jgi:molybdopterin biosynthesis enzyme MoaB